MGEKFNNDIMELRLVNRGGNILLRSMNKQSKVIGIEPMPYNINKEETLYEV